jgi:O-antigen ligase
MEESPLSGSAIAMRRPRAARRGARIGLDEGVRRGLAQAWAPANQARTTVFAAALLLTLAAALFGGASQANALSLMAVELASLPLLFVSLYQLLAGGAPQGARWPLALLVAIVAVPLLQLVPLPASVWTGLPGRGAIPDILDVAKLGRPSMPFSLTPEQTWRSAMALAPPAAMFLGALLLSEGQRRALAGCWLAMAVVSLVVGALQMLSGPDSALYFYRITNAGSAVGLFANRNHQAALLFCLMPLAGAFAARFDGDFRDRRAFAALLAVLYVLVAIVDVGVTRSRAGLFLGVFALAAAAAVVVRGGAPRRHWRAAAATGGVTLAIIAAVLVVGLTPILARFDGGYVEPRFQDWPLVVKAAGDFMPLGSGVGSFETVYNSVEPLGDVGPFYFNHAHNDYLELWLETGVVGPALALLFAAWLVMRMASVWAGKAASGDRDLAAGASLLLLLLLAHSAVDYPLRTEALAVLFAFACAAIAAYGRPEKRVTP